MLALMRTLLSGDSHGGSGQQTLTRPARFALPLLGGGRAKQRTSFFILSFCPNHNNLNEWPFNYVDEIKTLPARCGSRAPRTTTSLMHRGARVCTRPRIISVEEFNKRETFQLHHKRSFPVTSQSFFSSTCIETPLSVKSSYLSSSIRDFLVSISKSKSASAKHSSRRCFRCKWRRLIPPKSHFRSHFGRGSVSDSASSGKTRGKETESTV